MIDEFIARYPRVSSQVDKKEIKIVLEALDSVLANGVPGSIVEFGCYEGTMSLFMQRLLTNRQQARELHLYDSFQGLPAKTQEDQSVAGDQFQAAVLVADKKRLIRHFRQASLPMPHVHKGWFSETAPRDVPNPIALAFLDGDFYLSIRDSLGLIEDKLSPGAIIIVDDYQSEALPGAAKALDEWLITHPGKLSVEASLAIVRTPSK